MVSLNLLAVVLGTLSRLDRIVFLLLVRFWFTLHSEEDHLLLAHFFNRLTRQDASDQTLDCLCRIFFSFLFGLLLAFAIMKAFPHITLFKLSSDFLQSTQVTATTLTTSLIFLNQTDRTIHV